AAARSGRRGRRRAAGVSDCQRAGVRASARRAASRSEAGERDGQQRVGQTARLRHRDAARLGPEATRTTEGAIVGTVAYIAPEQAVGKAVDEGSDIFSLGAVLYELISGERAFAGESAAEVLSAIL